MMMMDDEILLLSNEIYVYLKMKLTIIFAAKHWTYLAVMHGNGANKKHVRYLLVGTFSKLL